MAPSISEYKLCSKTDTGQVWCVPQKCEGKSVRQSHQHQQALQSAHGLRSRAQRETGWHCGRVTNRWSDSNDIHERLEQIQEAGRAEIAAADSCSFHTKRLSITTRHQTKATLRCKRLLLATSQITQKYVTRPSVLSGSKTEQLTNHLLQYSSRSRTQQYF